MPKTKFDVFIDCKHLFRYRLSSDARVIATYVPSTESLVIGSEVDIDVSVLKEAFAWGSADVPLCLEVRLTSDE